MWIAVQWSAVVVRRPFSSYDSLSINLVMTPHNGTYSTCSLHVQIQIPQQPTLFQYPHKGQKKIGEHRRSRETNNGKTKKKLEDGQVVGFASLFVTRSSHLLGSTLYSEYVAALRSFTECRVIAMYYRTTIVVNLLSTL